MALADPTPGRLDILARRLAIPRTSTRAEDLIEDPGLDALFITTPHTVRVPLALAALEAGKHLYLEKPLTADPGEARALAAAATRHSGCVVYCAPPVGKAHVAAARLVAAGKLGTISGAWSRASHAGPEWYYRSVRKLLGEEDRIDEQPWFFDAGRTDAGALYDMGIYALANLVAVVGKVTEVTARLATVVKPTQLEDTATLILRLNNGALATVETGWCDSTATRGMHVHGTEGKIILPGENKTPLSLYTPENKDSESPPARREDLEGAPDVLPPHAEFLACIREHRQPAVSNITFAVHLTEILHAAVHSARENRTIPLEQEP